MDFNDTEINEASTLCIYNILLVKHICSFRNAFSKMLGLGLDIFSLIKMHENAILINCNIYIKVVHNYTLFFLVCLVSSVTCDL